MCARVRYVAWKPPQTSIRHRCYQVRSVTVVSGMTASNASYLASAGAVRAAARANVRGLAAASCRPFATGFPADWEKMATKEIKGKDVAETLIWNTPEGVAVKPLYTKADVEVRDRSNALPPHAFH